MRETFKLLHYIAYARANSQHNCTMRGENVQEQKDTDDVHNLLDNSKGKRLHFCNKAPRLLGCESEDDR